MNRASKKTLGMPVYSVREGQNLGFVKTLVMDPGDKAVLALVIERRRMTREERIIPFIHIQSIGDDVIVVDKASSAERKANLPQIISHMRNPIHILGARVFTVGGKILGKVEEFYFDTQSGKIMSLEIGGTTGAIFKEKVTIDGKYIVTMASGTVMMDDKALENMEVVENPILNSVGNAKDKAANIINGTINTSKKISKNISNSWEKLNNNGNDDGYVSFDQEEELKEAKISEETTTVDNENNTAAPIIETEAATDKENQETAMPEQPEKNEDIKNLPIDDDPADFTDVKDTAAVNDETSDIIDTNIEDDPIESHDDTAIDTKDDPKT